MKKWTILIFMAGDNDLDHFARLDLKEMRNAGTSPDIDIVVQFDSTWTGTKRYHLEPDGLVQVGEPLGDTNTGDPQVLAGFIVWGMQNYPARYTMLVIWNHGSGWENLPADFDWASVRAGNESEDVAKRAIFTTTIRRAYRQQKEVRAIALDATSRDYLDNQELHRALVEGLQGRTLDILGFDACLMSAIEIAYELRDTTHFMVASQEEEPGFGWPYYTVLLALYEHPELTPQQLSETIVRLYAQMGKDLRAPTQYTLSALDIARLQTVFDRVQALVKRLDAGYPDSLLLTRAVHEVSRLGRGAKRFQNGSTVDLFDWAWRLRRLYSGPDAALSAALDDLLQSLVSKSGLVSANAAEVGDDRSQVHGVSIYLPQPKKYSPAYQDLDFAKTGWGQFASKLSENFR